MGWAGRLYRGETNLDFIGTRKRWYIASAVLGLICLAAILLRGFNWGIEFSGGTSFVFNEPKGTTITQVQDSVESAGVEVQSAQEAGRGSDKKYVIKTKTLSPDQTTAVKNRLSSDLGVKTKDITDNAVSSSWGGQVTDKALIALVVFLVLVAGYLAIRFELKMAIAALLALLHDLLLTAGVYSIVGFEVTPSTVVGLLTILGFSLYDTVVVFDKVSEDTRDILKTARISYEEAANNAVNETLMRSINTSLISLLPVGGLLFVGAGLLGVGTLKDLALVLFVGLAAGAYSSLFLATPWLVDLKLREPRFRTLRDKVAAKRTAAAAKAAVVAEESDDEDEAPKPKAASSRAERLAARARAAGGDDNVTDSSAEAEDTDADDTDDVDTDDTDDDADDADREVATAGVTKTAAGRRPGQGNQRRRHGGGGGRPGRPSGSRKRR